MESGGVHLILGQHILALYLNDKVTVYNWLHLNILSQFFNVMELFGHCPKEPDFKRRGLRPLGGSHNSREAISVYRKKAVLGPNQKWSWSLQPADVEGIGKIQYSTKYNA